MKQRLQITSGKNYRFLTIGERIKLTDEYLSVVPVNNTIVLRWAKVSQSSNFHKLYLEGTPHVRRMLPVLRHGQLLVKTGENVWLFGVKQDYVYGDEFLSDKHNRTFTSYPDVLPSSRVSFPLYPLRAWVEAYRLLGIDINANHHGVASKLLLSGGYI